MAVQVATIFLLLISQKTRNSGCDNKVPVIGHCPINDFAVRLRKNKVLDFRKL